MKKILVQFVDRNRCTIVFQSHRGCDFGAKRLNYIISKNSDMEIKSATCPELFSEILYVRGASRQEDNNILEGPIYLMEKIETAIKDYNETFK